MNGTNPGQVKFGPFAADLYTHEIWKHGVKIKLVGQPFEVLAILLNRPGELVTREELHERLWPGDTFVDFDHGLNAAVNKLREALSDSVETPRYVETLPRRGYRFIATVERKNAETPEGRAAAPAAAPPPAEVAAPIPRPAIFRDSGEAQFAGRPRRLLLFGSLAAALVILTFATFIGAAWIKHHDFSGAVTGSTRVASQRIRPLTGLADETSEPAFSPDGNYVAFRRQSDKPGVSGIYVKAVGGDEFRQITNIGGDCCPAWAPDGQTIAFSRFADNNDIGIFLAPVLKSAEMPVEVKGQKLNLTLHGGEKRLDTQGVFPKRGELSWAPDGKSLVFASTSGIALLSLEDSTVHRLTAPPPLAEDWGPSFSPDGSRILFVRNSPNDIPEELFSVPRTGGEITRICAEHSRVLGPPQWSMDGQSIVYASELGGHPGLWRVPAEGKDAPAQINDSGWYPAISRRGYRLAYQRITHSLNIWELALNLPGQDESHKEQKILVPATSETDQGPGPQISPDGEKLAFMSDRSGTMEIWTSDRDGSNPVQLTAVGNAGTPRWSPDSDAVVFDATGRNGAKIYKIKLGSSEPQLLTPDESENRCPSWSHDGKWIYFASTRSNGYQVWKIPVEGGTPVQITKEGGHAALESADGKTLYYAKNAYANPEIWQVPVNGGAEKPVSAQVRPYMWASWSVTDRGIVFAGPSVRGRPLLRLYEPASRRLTDLGEINTVPFWIGVSRDAKTAVFDQPGWQQSQIMLVENFR